MKVVDFILLFLILILISILNTGCCMFDSPGYKGPISNHFDGKQFHNQEKGSGKGFFDLIKWQFSREKGYWAEWWDDKPGSKPKERIYGDSAVVTFINHSTVLIQVQGFNILTDPVWSNRISPFTWIGPTRHRAPGIRFEDLPPIDVVLVSHNHYDHLDMPTLKLLKEAFNPIIIVPLGIKELLDRKELTNSKEIDWWDEIVLNSVDKNTEELIICLVPSRHFSMRGTCDRDNTLWGGFVIQSSIGPIYFAGDTGFGKHFEQIFNKFGPISLAFIPIGAYRPRWFMADNHISPTEAVQASIILHAATSVAIHWGTFPQADDGIFEPVIDLKEVMKNEKITKEQFIVPKHGIGIVVHKPE
jgi:L-ascorbate metabolism protein UlaG (beta-lactamase superfamily)